MIEKNSKKRGKKIDEMTKPKTQLEAEIAEISAQNQILETKLTEKRTALHEIRNKAVRTQRDTEMEEEFISNNLFRRLDSIKREKRQLEQRLRTEERARGELLNQIAQVRRQKELIENTIENEQEKMTHELQRQLVSVSRENSGLEKRLHEARSAYLTVIQNHLVELTQKLLPCVCSPTGAPTTDQGENGEGAGTTAAVTDASIGTNAAVGQLKDEVASLLLFHERQAEETSRLRQQCSEMHEQLRSLQLERQAEHLRAIRLGYDLEKAQNELLFERRRMVRMSTRSASQISDSSEDAMPASAPTPTGEDVITRTKRVLSTASTTSCPKNPTHSTPPPPAPAAAPGSATTSQDKVP